MMTVCRECHAPISADPSVSKCPHCGIGRPAETKDPGPKYLIVGLILLVALPPVGMIVLGLWLFRKELNLR
jgi:hypothetical protein